LRLVRTYLLKGILRTYKPWHIEPMQNAVIRTKMTMMVLVTDVVNVVDVLPVVRVTFFIAVMGAMIFLNVGTVCTNL